jgi:hypothetical protein
MAMTNVRRYMNVRKSLIRHERVKSLSFRSIRVHFTCIGNILMWIHELCSIYYKSKRFTIGYLCVLFVGDGVKRWPRGNQVWKGIQEITLARKLT